MDLVLMESGMGGVTPNSILNDDVKEFSSSEGGSVCKGIKSQEDN
jgi:hypothetical protein